MARCRSSTWRTTAVGCLGLHHAFDKGMVHRDIKPNNLMLTQVEKKHVVKILDFGLAKANHEKELLAGLGDSPAAGGGLTETGQILGTPAYLAPEQVLDPQQADIRADIYSLGCTLYCLLSGRAPFPGNNISEVLHAHRHAEATALDLLRPEVPSGMAAVVGRMMAKQPSDRYRTPAEVADALAPFCKASTQGQGVKTEPAPSPPAVETASSDTPAPAITAAISRAVPPPIVPPPIPKAKRRANGTPRFSSKLTAKRIAAGTAAVFALLLGVIVIVRHDRNDKPPQSESPPQREAPRVRRSQPACMTHGTNCRAPAPSKPDPKREAAAPAAPTNASTGTGRE